MTTLKSTDTRSRLPLKPHNVRQIEARSRARCLKVRTYEVEPHNCYYCHSQSEPGTAYHVTRERHGWECECKGYRFTGLCKHIAAVERRSEREGWQFGRIARHRSAADQATTDLITSMLRAD